MYYLVTNAFICSTYINKFFKAYDKHVLDKEKRKETGEDSPFKKFIKKLFGTALLVGGVPLLTGFMKEVFVPIIKDKLTPWFKETLIPGLIGVKNPNTGEYEGGLISGIVNPIRDFFKDKFKIVHDWFNNDGKFNNDYSGMRGMINNLKGAAKYAIDLWKSGASTILTEFLPNAVETIIANSWDIAKNLLKGILNGIKGLAKNIISGKDDFDGYAEAISENVIVNHITKFNTLQFVYNNDDSIEDDEFVASLIFSFNRHIQAETFNIFAED